MQAFARTALAGSKFGGAGGVGSDFVGEGGSRSGTGRPTRGGSSRLAKEQRLSQRYFNSRPIRNYAAVTRPTRHAQEQVQVHATTIQDKDEQEDDNGSEVGSGEGSDS